MSLTTPTWQIRIRSLATAPSVRSRPYRQATNREFCSWLSTWRSNKRSSVPLGLGRPANIAGRPGYFLVYDSRGVDSDNGGRRGRGFRAFRGVRFSKASSQPGLPCRQETPALKLVRRPDFRPNIVYIHSHDSGRYLSPYGQSVPTPNLQRLAQEGILFRKAFSAAPTCSPSRAALLTGLYPHSSGMLGLAHRGFSLNDYQQHIVHTLKPAGYTSVLAGLQHVAKVPETIGYDKVLPHKDTSAVHVAPAAVGFLDSRPTSPFFLDIGFFETHREYPEATAEDKANYSPLPRPIPDTAATRGDFARYRASARIMDEGVGKVLEAIDRNGYRREHADH